MDTLCLLEMPCLIYSCVLWSTEAEFRRAEEVNHQTCDAAIWKRALDVHECNRILDVKHMGGEIGNQRVGVSPYFVLKVTLSNDILLNVLA